MGGVRSFVFILVVWDEGKNVIFGVKRFDFEFRRFGFRLRIEFWEFRVVLYEDNDNVFRIFW